VLAPSAASHRTGVETGVHLHDAHSGALVTREQGALDRRRPAPARQQGGVDVDAAERRQLEHGRGQD
jgi:hypothetical protein